MNRKWLLLLALIFGLGSFVFYLFLINRTQKTSTQITTTVPGATNVQVVIPPSDFTPPSDYVLYSSDTLGLKLYYPGQMQVVENQGSDLRIFLLGPTQSTGTEMYDGISMNFEFGTYTQDSLIMYLLEDTDRKRNEDVYQEISAVEPYALNGLNGYRYTEVALGDFTQVYFDLEDGRYLHISYLVEDPESQGFEMMVTNILRSLEIN